ncbi:MAG: nucleotidyl transferase AbiEii/AbiGii toxin family protein [Alphaproteobacteria bacterium]|nr:nucleotidyl transferase AbiEii/AbiGii toxin family protein [Alphaproteobacteria bacterium]
MAASVRARLTDRARANKENVQLVLTRYAIERLLYRLSQSPYRNLFVLKGAMLFSLWAAVPYRATGDLDLLGFGANDVAALAETFRALCAVPVDDDGVQFRPDTIKVDQVREDRDYQGVRVTMIAIIAGARMPVQIDVGYGDAVTPAPQDIDYPTLLEFAAPRLRAYPPETVVAEKFQALVDLGMLNTRMKDFYDVWAIATTFSFDGATLAQAIQATFARRATALPSETPVALTPAFAAASTKQAQWDGFIRRTAIAMEPEPLAAILIKAEAFLMPPALALHAGAPFALTWQPGGPWR